MILTAISDLHGEEPNLPGGDLLIMAGDLTLSDRLNDWHNFYNWLRKQPYEKKIMIGGNHDNQLMKVAPDEKWDEYNELKFTDSIYLCDNGLECFGYKIWGSPWTPAFLGMHHRYAAFTVPWGKSQEEELLKYWAQIPEDTDILITHLPPHGQFDEVRGAHVGSRSLKETVERIKPKIHIFGHIHEHGGEMEIHKDGRISINAAYLAASYVDYNNIITITI